jgi:hypothetical protein
MAGFDTNSARWHCHASGWRPLEFEAHFPTHPLSLSAKVAPIRTPVAKQAAGEKFYKLLLGLPVPPGSLRHGWPHQLPRLPIWLFEAAW